MSEVKQKFDDISKNYDAERRKLIPCFDDFYSVAVTAASVDSTSPKILDLGAGTGLLTSFILNKYSDASVTLIDLSDKMLEIARQRFEGNKNIRFVVGDYVNFTANETYDIIVSALSIHHLDDSSKKAVYKKCYSLLKPNGILINADQVHGETPFIEDLNKKTWKKSIESSDLTMDEIQAAYERTRLDKEATLDQQLVWLKEAGFSDVGCVYKYYVFAVMIGRKI